MYLTHFSLNERPFSISPDPRFLFMSNRYREALAHLTYGVEDGGGFVLLTGEVGTGKTTVCRCLLQQLPDKTRLAFVLNPKLDSLELLATICDELGIEYPENCTSLKTLTDNLSQYLLSCYEQGLSVVVMIDEAQNIDTDVLEQIRLLTNLETNQKKLLQIILVGQPELQEKLAQRDLRQLAQRITARYHLRPLNLKETMAYVLHRIRIAGNRKSLFTRKSIELLHSKTSGIPRLINTICDRALVAACSRNRNQIDHNIMREAIRDVMGSENNAQTVNALSGVNWISWGTGSILAVALLGLVFWLGQLSNNSVVTDVSNKKSQVEDVVPQQNQPADSQQALADSESVNANNPQVNSESSQISLVDRMIANERWDNNGNWSMQQLMSLWQVDYSPLRDGAGCEFAGSYGLVCQSMQGNWQQLRQFDRPAILKFSAGLQGEFWGTLKTISGVEATLIFGARESVVRLDELSTIWTGEYQLLWQAPDGYNGDLKMGDQGIAVEWLRGKMKLLIDSQLVPSQNFDSSLKNALRKYQSQRNINADGIAGMQTILTINGETLVGIPQLTEQ